jgi:hypothetical protein
MEPGRYQITVHVADNGTPSLSVSQTFVVAVVGVGTPGIDVSAPTFFDGRLNISWASTPGALYRVQFTTDLGSGLWRNVDGDVLATTTTSMKTDILPSGDSNRFYRVVKVP